MYHVYVGRVGGATPPGSDETPRLAFRLNLTALKEQRVTRLRHSGRFSLPFPSISCGIVTASGSSASVLSYRSSGSLKHMLQPIASIMSVRTYLALAKMGVK